MSTGTYKKWDGMSDLHFYGFDHGRLRRLRNDRTFLVSHNGHLHLVLWQVGSRRFVMDGGDTMTPDEVDRVWQLLPKDRKKYGW